MTLRLVNNAVALLLAASVGIAFAQGLPTARPEEVGMSSVRLGALKTSLQAEVDKKKSPARLL